MLRNNGLRMARMCRSAHLFTVGVPIARVDIIGVGTFSHVAPTMAVNDPTSEPDIDRPKSVGATQGDTLLPTEDVGLSDLPSVRNASVLEVEDGTWVDTDM